MILRCWFAVACLADRLAVVFARRRDQGDHDMYDRAPLDYSPDLLADLTHEQLEDLIREQLAALDDRSRRYTSRHPRSAR